MRILLLSVISKLGISFLLNTLPVPYILNLKYLMMKAKDNKPSYASIAFLALDWCAATCYVLIVLIPAIRVQKIMGNPKETKK
jgi:hypothetical protein